MGHGLKTLTAIALISMCVNAHAFSITLAAVRSGPIPQAPGPSEGKFERGERFWLVAYLQGYAGETAFARASFGPGSIWGVTHAQIGALASGWETGFDQNLFFPLDGAPFQSNGPIFWIETNALCLRPLHGPCDQELYFETDVSRSMFLMHVPEPDTLALLGLGLVGLGLSRRRKAA